MFWPLNRSSKPRRGSTTHRSSRRLRVEGLESRDLLAGVVDIVPVVGGDLTLTGDVSNNQIQVEKAGAPFGPFDFRITGKSGTDLTLMGAPVVSPHIVLGITGDIIVRLEGGDDTFELGSSGGMATAIIDDLVIDNAEGGDVNIIRNADIGRDIRVTKVVGGGEYSELQILDTIVRGEVIVDNWGGPMGDGDSKTQIDRSEIEGRLDIRNGFGEDMNLVSNTSIGAALFVRPPGAPVDPVVRIDNMDGGSLTSFTSRNDPPVPPGGLPALGRPTIFGSVHVFNGMNSLLKSDIVSFTDAEVLGEVAIDNDGGPGMTETLVTSSEIGTDGIPSTLGGYGGPLSVLNGDGRDAFRMTDSEAQYGVDIDNNGPGGPGGQFWGSETEIRNSMIGTHPLVGSAAFPFAFRFQGDHGNDLLNINPTTFGGIVDLGGFLGGGLFGGNDQVTFIGSTMEALDLRGDGGDETVLLQDTVIHIAVNIELESGVDRLELRGQTVLPNPLHGFIVTIDGGTGADIYGQDASVLPPVLPVTNFELFLP